MMTTKHLPVRYTVISSVSKVPVQIIIGVVVSYPA